MNRLNVKFGRSTNPDAIQSVAEIHDQVVQNGMSGLIFFCSPNYDLEKLGAALKYRFKCAILGCTSAGEILSSTGYSENTIVAATISSQEFHIQTQFIESLGSFVAQTNPQLIHGAPGHNKFAILLIDGLSLLEERVAAKLCKCVGGIPIIGGSAGDALNLKKTWIYHDGAFHPNAAVVWLCETTLPFRLFKIQHFDPTNDKLVITDADVATRTVREINGLPAAEAYARIVGVDSLQLGPQVFASYPVMLRIGGQYYVRSIQKINPDGSLTFFCAIDNGLVLTVAKSSRLLENFKKSIGELEQAFRELKLVLGFDCILRRLELIQNGELEKARELLAPHHFIGFSTYGEQFNAIHVNHTLTGLALGE